MAKNEDKKKQQIVGAVCTVIILITLFLIMRIIGSGFGNSKSTSSSEQPAQEQAQKKDEGSDKKKSEKKVEKAEKKEEEPKQETQVFENDLAKVEYRETMDSTGNALVLFALTNKTDRPVMVSSENIVVNGEYQVTSLGGSDINGIQPGKTGQVSIVFGVEVQTPLNGVADLKTLTADLVLRDADQLTETLGTVPVDVTI